MQRSVRVALAAMLSLTLVGGLTACSGASGGGKSPNVAAIQKRGVLKAGVKVDVPKFGYKDPATGKIDGFEVDLARAVAKKLLGDPNKIELTAVTAKTRAALLDSGELDLVAATFTITDDRKKVLNFTDPYFTDGIAIMVKKSSGFTSLKDLDKKNIGVAKSATTKAALQAKAQALGIQPNFLEFDSYPEIKAALGLTHFPSMAPSSWATWMIARSCSPTVTAKRTMALPPPSRRRTSRRPSTTSSTA